MYTIFFETYYSCSCRRLCYTSTCIYVSYELLSLPYVLKSFLSFACVLARGRSDYPSHLTMIQWSAASMRRSCWPTRG